ncbi:hypothetical protein BGZ95_002470, partial [Linnemannia exigua]
FRWFWLERLWRFWRFWFWRFWFGQFWIWQLWWFWFWRLRWLWFRWFRLWWLWWFRFRFRRFWSGSGSGSGSGGSGSGGSGGSGSGGSGSGGSGSGGAGSGGSGSGGSGSSGSGSAGAGGSGTPDSSVPGATVPGGGIIPGSPFPNPDAGQVLVGANQTATVPVGVTPTPVPAVAVGGVLPDGASKTSDEGSHSKVGAIIGGTLGVVCLIGLVALLFLVAKRRRAREDAEAAEGPGGPGAANTSDNMFGGGGSMSPDGTFYSPGFVPPKHTPGAPGGGPTDMPPLAPTGGASGYGGPSGPAQEQVFGAGHGAHDDGSTENVTTSVLNAKRSSKAKFFMGGGDYKPPLRRPSPVLPESSNLTMHPITMGGSKTEVVDGAVEIEPREEHVVPGVGKTTNSKTTVSHINSGTSSSTTDNHKKGAIIAGIAGIAATAGTIAAVKHSSKDTRVDGPSSKTTTTKVTSTNGGKTTTMTTHDTEEILQGTDGALGGVIPGHGRFESTTSTGMNISGSSSVMNQSGSTQIVTSNGKSTIQRQQMPPTIHKTQITLKLSIIRYERSDASQATPSAKPGTLMFSQVEMLEGAPDVRIPGSAFSHVRDSSKITGQEENLPSPVVPVPSGAVRSTESEPRERSVRWMTNEFKWKREAGMLQHLRSDLHIAELFTLYSLPPFAEYRYVSVMGPFTRTLDTYIKERRGIRTTPPSQPLTPEQVSLTAKGPLTVVEIKSLTNSIASALKWCHDHHVVHLSLSPASVFLQEYYSEPDGQGGYRQSIYSNYSSRNSTVTDADAPTIVQHWKLWDFSNARFVGEAVDLTMETTGYTSPEILIAARRHTQKSTSVTKSTTEAENPNQDTTVTESVSPDGVVTKTTTIKASSSTENTTVIHNLDQEKLMATQTMDMWSLGQIVYEMHTTQPMFTGAQDALVKLTSALEKQEGSAEYEDDDGGDLDKAKAHDKIREQLQDQIKKIESIRDMGAREVITGLLEMRQERRLDHEEVRNMYLDLQE